MFYRQNRGSTELIDYPYTSVECYVSPRFTTRFHISTMHNFVKHLYVIQGDRILVDDATLNLFLHKGKLFDQLPPSRDALHQNILKSSQHAAHM